MADEKEAGLSEAFRKLEFRDQVTVAGTGLAFVLGILPWYSFESLGVSESTSGFGPWYGKLFFLTCLATVGLIMRPSLRERVLGKLGPDARALTVPVLTAATLVFGPVFFFIDTGGTLEPAAGIEISEGRTLWFYIALLAAVAAAATAWRKWKAWLDQI